LKGYDAHHIIRAFDKHSRNRDKLRITCIPTSGEKYISFSIGTLRFIDSMAFMNTSIEKLVSGNLKSESKKISVEEIKKMTAEEIRGEEKKRTIELIKENFQILTKKITDEYPEINDKMLYNITRKGIYPYDYADDPKKFNEKMPPRDEYKNELSGEGISEKDFKRVNRVCRIFGIKNFGEYQDLYLKTDVLLLSDVFEKFRRVAMKNYGLDPIHYYTLPGYAWDVMLKTTEVKIELMKDVDMYIFGEKGIRGGISTMFKRLSEANNHYMDEKYNPNEENKYLLFVDANNLYGGALVKKLPICGSRWR